MAFNPSILVREEEEGAVVESCQIRFLMFVFCFSFVFLLFYILIWFYFSFVAG